MVLMEIAKALIFHLANKGQLVCIKASLTTVIGRKIISQDRIELVVNAISDA